jgi:peptide methionine sulfoxide reductase msrA/msrB
MIQQIMKSHRLIAVTLLLLTQTIVGCSQPENNVSIKNLKVGTVMTVHKTDEEWKKQLSPDQYYVLRQKGTEQPFTGKLLLNKEKGVYKCEACGNELFTDDMKFDSECGWPSFDKEIAGGKIKTVEDNSLDMHRTEINCGRCGSHLGHLFNDGPTKTGLRYCVNSLSLEFVSTKDQQKSIANTIDTITLGGGCYWCVEAIYQQLDGVIKAESGFSGGHVANPSYEAVSTGKTGHAEVVQITYDNTKISLAEILKVFFSVHDPTTLNRQGADVGTQYRSVIFYRNQQQQQQANDIIKAQEKEHIYDNPIVTTEVAFDQFYKAPDYHQNYYNQNKQQPYCRLVIQPKLEKFEKIFADRLKKK